MNGDFVVGIPTLDRPESLKRCVEAVLRSTVTPKDICVVDNGGNVDPDTLPAGGATHIEVVKTPYNLGVAASWNLLHDMYAPSDIIYLNDDVILERETAADILSAPRDYFLVFIKVPRSYGGYRQFTERPDMLWYGGGWSCFLQREDCWHAVGRYDELYWPAYWEDSDYGIRLTLAAVRPHVYACESFFKHGMSHRDVAPFAAMSQETREHISRFARWNGARFMLKWGEDFRRKPFAAPFDGASVDELDLYLNRGIIQHHVIEPEVCDDDLHLITRYSRECRSVVEMGRRCGGITCALLAGRPKRLVSVGSAIRPEVFKLIQLKGPTSLDIRTSMEPTNEQFDLAVWGDESEAIREWPRASQHILAGGAQPPSAAWKLLETGSSIRVYQRC